MKISICIPQYNRIDYLLKNLEIISKQTYIDIEVVVSDDNSTDDTCDRISALIETYRYPLIYKRNKINQGFDRNLRQSLELASGDYLLILGNDDSLNFPDAVENLVNFLSTHDFPEIGFCNYVEEKNRDSVIRRAAFTHVYESTPETAIRFYKSFSFVAGLIFKRETFHLVNTDKYDGSIFVQVYMAMKAVLLNSRFFTIEDPLVLKDINLPDQVVNSYRDTLIKKWSDFKVVDGGLLSFSNVAFRALQDTGHLNVRYSYTIIRDIYRYTLPYWILDYKRNNAFVNAIGIFKGLKPSGFANYKSLPLMNRLKLHVYYYAGSTGAFIIPVIVFNQLQHKFYAFIKK